MKTLLVITTFLLILVTPSKLSAQYWGERVLEKSFEQTDFFFVPSYLSPYGIGSFRSTTPGLLKDPLLDVIVNPARLALDSAASNYLYTDFRSARDVTNGETGFYPPWIGYLDTRATVDVLYYPRVYVNTRRELEPVFSGAFISRPLPSTARDFLVGFTYQLVMQDEKYYDIPQDIYRSVIGYDYNGMRAAAADNIPIVDKYSGEDNMHQAGHFVTGFARYVLPMGLEIGAKIGRVMFNRDGSFGSSNFWQYSPSSSGASLWSNLEARDQGYSHWDVSGGVEYHLNGTTTLGTSVGHLWGDATQALRNNDSSYYSYSYAPNSSFYNQSGNTLHLWQHSGRTTYIGFDLTSQVTPTSTLILFYQHQGTTVDIGLGSSILDTSYSTYTWMNGSTPATSYSQSYLSDVRGGGGTQSVTTNRLQASLQFKVDQKVNLSIGALVEWQDTETSTDEAVLVANHSAYWSADGSWNQQYGGGESKDLLWTFSAHRTSFQVPVFVTVRATEGLEFLFGVNRNMAQWKIDDVTLALFRYRMSIYNGTVTRDENFGERYTEPTEQVSDVRTTFLGGLTVSPSRNLKLRLLMVPNFQDTFQGTELQQLQWWIGLVLTP